jgi:uncharacterized damage-inducible protein DinB
MATDIGTEYIGYCRRRLLHEYLPKITRCVEELSDDDIWWRSHETDNSIGNLILHLSGNVRQWIVSGIGGAADSRNRPAEFAERAHISKTELLHTLERALRDADDALARFDTSRLMEVRPIQKWEVTCLDAISHVIEHFALHTGQIIYITKLKKGIDLRFYDL